MTQTTQTVKASFDIESIEGQVKLFNAQNGGGVSLKDVESGTIIEANGIAQYADKTDQYGQEQEAVVTCLFGTDGVVYSSISNPVAQAGEKLIELLAKIDLPEFKVKVITQTSKGGRDFLSLQIVM